MLFRLLTSFIILCLLTFSTVYSYAAPFQEEAEKKESTKEADRNPRFSRVF